MMVNNFLKKIKVKTRMNSMGDSVRKQVILLIVLFLTMCILRPSMFLTINNLQAMTYQFPEYGLIALGVMFAMIAGGIDLSLVGVANLDYLCRNRYVGAGNCRNNSIMCTCLHDYRDLVWCPEWVFDFRFKSTGYACNIGNNAGICRSWNDYYKG